MTNPAINTELPSDCLKRCESFQYELVADDTKGKNADLFAFDVYIYFASNEVEVWSKAESFNLLTLLSNVGGLMGLLLGASVFTVIGSLIHLINGYLIKRLKTGFDE